MKKRKDFESFENNTRAKNEIIITKLNKLTKSISDAHSLYAFFFSIFVGFVGIVKKKINRNEKKNEQIF